MKKLSIRSLTHAFLLIGMVIVAPPARSQKKGQKRQAITEVFHVSRIGMAGAAESRELLLELYQSIE